MGVRFAQMNDSALPRIVPAVGLGPSLRLRGLLRDRPRLRAAALSAGALARSLERAPAGVYTLCYHHVPKDTLPNFAAQLALMARQGTFISVDAAVERLGAGKPIQERLFVLTFDDGYLDTVEVAMPAIQRQGIPAMLFLVSDWLDAPPDDGQTYAGRGEVSAWIAAGLDIGSHTMSHRRLSGLQRPDVAAELNGSAAALGEIWGRPVRHFACPWGVAEADYRPARDVALAREAGYETFFTTRRGRANDAASLMAMPRHVLEPEWPTSSLETLMGGWRFGRR